ncbi:MAG: C25 family cysteine peptidase, partial [Candidatus Poribacteria bacterium]
MDHYVMISVNENRVGEEARWNSQDIYKFDGQIPVNSINEGFDNKLRLARIGTNASDGEDMDSYPYQFYLNWFELGYFRKLMAVEDTLEFSAPEQKVAKPLASISLENSITLDKGRIPADLQQRLKNVKVTLSDKAIISILKQGNSWMLSDNQKAFFIIKESDKINVYANESNDYTVSGFLNSDIEVFQISESNAICKFKDVIVKEYGLNQDDKKRLRDIIQHNSDSFRRATEEKTDKFSTIKIPNSAYAVTFEDDDVQNFQYIAVTPSSILIPDRIEIDNPSNLKGTTNRADYIIISHPVFLESAKKLARWRSESAGGGFATRVIDVTDIYDEFGNGMVSPYAIKDFLKYAYNNWQQPAPSYVLIFGDGTYDFLGIDKKAYEEAPELIGFIPSFYIKTTFGQTAVDHWYSTIDGKDGFPDIYLGRIPVETVEEANNAVEKIISNESLQVNGAWRKQIISVADDETNQPGDEIFQEGLEDIWDKHTPVGYDTTKIYLKEIIKQVNQNPDEKRIPAEVTRDMIIDAFAKGAVIAQFSGHGGRHVWTHEIIFSITDIEKMREAEAYPFLLVFSCYNGYFDIPGELSMSEGMIRAKKKGVTSMLAATRLTYGQGNLVLNNLLFDSIFKDKLLRVGQATAVSKIRLLKEEGMIWLTQMFQYTLFGDPASRLNIADYEANLTAKNASVSPGGKLETLSTQFVKSVGGQSVNVSGAVTASIIYPNGLKESKNINISNGIYPSTTFDIPQGMARGSAQLNLYGQFGAEYAVGGMNFMIGQPLFKSINQEVSDGKVQIYAKIDDDADASKMKSVTLAWYSNSGQKDLPMVYDQNKNAYKLQDILTLPADTANTLYKVIAEDKDGNKITSDLMSIESSPNINLYIS